MKSPGHPPLFTLLLATLLATVSVVSRAAVVCSGPDAHHGAHVALAHESTGCDGGHDHPEPASDHPETPCDDTPIEIDQVRPDHADELLDFSAAVWGHADRWSPVWDAPSAQSGPPRLGLPLKPPGLSVVTSIRFNL